MKLSHGVKRVGAFWGQSGTAAEVSMVGYFKVSPNPDISLCLEGCLVKFLNNKALDDKFNTIQENTLLRAGNCQTLRPAR